MKEQVVLQDVCKTINGKTVLDHINLTLEAGKAYCFCGRNGSGKTMLLRAIAGLIHVEGKVIVFDKEITKDNSFPDDMGLLIEKTEMWPQFSAMDNLRILAEIRGVIGEQEMKEALIRVGLDPEDTRKMRAYSMGMKQKLAIAQAIMEKPRLLLLDEPTNGLDDKSVILFQKIIREEKERGCLILLATHQMEDVEELCDQVFRISEGCCYTQEKNHEKA